MFFEALALTSTIWSKGMRGARNIAQRSKETRITFTVSKELVATSTRATLWTFLLAFFTESSWRTSIFTTLALNSRWANAGASNWIARTAILAPAFLVATISVSSLGTRFITKKSRVSWLTSTAESSDVAFSTVLAVVTVEHTSRSECSTNTWLPEVWSFES